MNAFKKLEKFLADYRMVIGIVVIILLATLCILTYINFDKQNQIIETGGFVEGKVKCVCTQEAWDQFENEGMLNNISNMVLYNG